MCVCNCDLLQSMAVAAAAAATDLSQGEVAHSCETQKSKNPVSLLRFPLMQPPIEGPLFTQMNNPSVPEPSHTHIQATS